MNQQVGSIVNLNGQEVFQGPAGPNSFVMYSDLKGGVTRLADEEDAALESWIGVRTPNMPTRVSTKPFAFVEKNHDVLKDSGERRQFDTGAVRDRGAMKGRADLRAVHALQRYDLHNERGAAKYAARNWEKGMPLSEFFNSAQRHADKLLAGYTDEDHEAAWVWNVMHFIETKHRIKQGILPKNLDDMPETFAAQQPEF